MTETAVVARRPPVDRAGLVAAMALAVVVFVLSWLRHRNHWSGFDLAIFDQAAWQLAHGRSHISIVERHVLADHLSPVLFLFGFLYRLVPTTTWLLGAQALAVGATVLPMRGVARHFGQPPSRATLLVALSSPLLAAGLFDFHPSTLAVPFLAAAIYYGLEARPMPTVLAAGAAALCRADIALVLLAIAIVTAPRVRRPLVAVALLAGAASAVVPGRFGETNGWSPHFGHLGSSPTQALIQPWRVAAELLSPGSLSIFLLWIIAGGVVVLFRPRWVLALVVAGLPVLLSRWSGTKSPLFHYGAPMVPLVIGGTLAGLAVAAARHDRWSRRAELAWWSGPVFLLLLLSPVSPLFPDSQRVWTFAFGDDGRDVAGVVALVGEDDAVSAGNGLLPQLSQREHLYLYPLPFGSAPTDFFAEGSEPDSSQYGPDAVDVIVAQQGEEDLVPADRFEVVARLDGFVVFRRIVPAP